MLSGDKGIIEKVLPRRNQLKRPPVSNVDMALILLSKEPIPDLHLVDKMLVSLSLKDIAVTILVTKSDLGQDELYNTVKANYERHVDDVMLVSIEDVQSIERVKEKLKGKMTCVIGQSAVGKSTLINALQSEKSLETGGLSRIKRGRHTTRHSEIIKVDEGSYIVDTPGFSFFDLNLDPNELKKHYFDFNEHSDKCRFRGCNHINEPDCEVKKAVSEGLILAERYERYIELYNELNEKWRKKYG